MSAEQKVYSSASRATLLLRNSMFAKGWQEWQALVVFTAVQDADTLQGPLSFFQVTKVALVWWTKTFNDIKYYKVY